jgi:hypothetical protein
MRGTAAQCGSFRYASLFAGLAGLLAAIGAAGAQTPQPPSNLAVTDAPTPTMNSVQVFLVRQDTSNCTNSTVSNADGPLVSGDVTIVRDSNGTTELKVAMTASPDMTYHVFLKCVRQIGA